METYHLVHPSHPAESLAMVRTDEGREVAWEMLMDGLAEILDLVEGTLAPPYCEDCGLCPEDGHLPNCSRHGT